MKGLQKKCYFKKGIEKNHAHFQKQQPCWFLSAYSDTTCCQYIPLSVQAAFIYNSQLTPSRPNEESQGWMGYFGQALKTSANYLPSQVTEMFNQGRDFAVARLPFSSLKNVCAITKWVMSVSGIYVLLQSKWGLMFEIIQSEECVVC